MGSKVSSVSGYFEENKIPMDRSKTIELDKQLKVIDKRRKYIILHLCTCNYNDFYQDPICLSFHLRFVCLSSSNDQDLNHNGQISLSTIKLPSFEFSNEECESTPFPFCVIFMYEFHNFLHMFFVSQCKTYREVVRINECR